MARRAILLIGAARYDDHQRNNHTCFMHQTGIDREKDRMKIFEVSREPRLLNQYYELRERCYREELELEDFDGSEEPLDREGDILLVHQGGQCIGGARISPALSLPFELPELRRAGTRYCVWERFAVAPEHRSLQLIKDFNAALIECSLALGYDRALVLSSLRNARFYRQCHSALGVEFEIRRSVPEISTGAFAGLEHYLSLSRLQPPGAPMQLAA